MKRWNRNIVFNYWYSQVCTCVVVLLFLFVGFLGGHFWISSILEWLCVFLYMTLTMLIMTALPSQDQITLSLHIKHNKKLFEMSQDKGAEPATTPERAKESDNNAIN